MSLYNINSDEQYRKIILSRIRLDKKMPFLGTICSIFDIEIIEDDDNRFDFIPKNMRTAFTDGRKVYYFRSFVKSLNDEEILFLTAHEICHIIQDHCDKKRIGDRDRVYWNMAADYNINSYLVDNNIGKMPSMGLYDKKYTYKKLTEEIYEELIKNNEGKKDTLDIHLTISISDNTSSISNTSSSNELSIIEQLKNKLNITDQEAEKISKEIKSKIFSVYEQMKNDPSVQKMAGILPLGIERFVEEFTGFKKISWKELLRGFLVSNLPYDQSYHVFSKRNNNDYDIIFPGIIEKEKISIFVAFDTSGSMTEEDISIFRSEIINITEEFDCFDITLCCFDTEIYNVEKIEEDNFDLLYNYKFKGGGGTSLKNVFSYMKENNIVPKKMIVFTDGYINDWGDPNYCDTIFIIKNNIENISAPYGLSIKYDK